ncbi:unnamed protein product [Toxocara canis]|uniref:DUF4440 domain-containing protein n=1 Tax=Toxocara canis TaxID=6265 RepID=A0A183VGU4_TOXCA|nr:unnamed protein product [Toxocara canis]
MHSGVAEFQKLHEHFIALRKAGKENETLKYCTEGCYFMSPFSEPQSAKDAIKTMKDPKLQEMSKGEVTLTVDEVQVSGDFAGDRGRFVVKDKDGEKKGSYLCIWRKDGSSWKAASICITVQMPI